MREGRKAAKVKNLGRYLVFIVVPFFLLLMFFNLTRSSIWNGVRRFTIVIQANGDENQEHNASLALLSLEPEENRAEYLIFPGSTLLDVPYGYKTYLTSSIYRLGELEKKGYGGVLLSKSIESTFGVAVDGYLVTTDSNFLSLPQNKNDVKQVKSAYFSLIGGIRSLPKLLVTLRKTDTNLSFIDRWRLWNAIREIRSDQINFRDLSGSQALQEDQLPDGTKILQVDKELFDVAIKDGFQDTVIRSDNITLEVVNATGKERIASEFSRILEHMGGNVILKTTAKNRISDGCLLYFSSPKFASAAITSRLKQLYKCSKKDTINVESNLADIKIVLGEGFMK